MSFGFGVGDFIAVLEVVERVRKKVAKAPKEYQDIAEEVRILGKAIRAAATVDPEDNDVSGYQQGDLAEIAQACRDALERLEKELDKFEAIGSNQGTIVSVKGRMKRGWQRFRFDAADIRVVSQQLTSRVNSFNTVQLSNNTQTVNTISKSLERLNAGENERERYINTIIEGVNRLNYQEEDRKRDEILEWITPVDYASKHHDFINRRQEGTGQWFLNSAEYQNWLDRQGETLFCPGIPGAGKTMLTAIVIDDLMGRFRNTLGVEVGIAYVYCNFRSHGEQTESDILASLLKQLCNIQDSVPDCVKDLHKECTEKRLGKGRRPSLFELKAKLREVADTFSDVFILVDALDECQSKTMRDVVSDLFVLQSSCDIRFLATSRFIPEILLEFNNNERSSPSVEVRASDEDVLRYLGGQMDQLPRFVRTSKELQDQIGTQIVQSVEGMFLLAQLHFRSLLGVKTKKALFQALSRLPSGSNAYNDAYKEAMLRIADQNPELAELGKRVLAWITCAKRPLSVLELQHALAVEEGEDEVDPDNILEVEDIVSVCAGLVTVDEESSIVRLVHYTTQEYFQRTQKDWFPDGEVDMATVCLRYISFPAFEAGKCRVRDDFDKRIAAYPLYSYASNSWGYHLRPDWEACKDLLDEFQGSQAKVQAAAQAVPILLSRHDTEHYHVLWEPEQDVTALHLMTYFGLHEAVDFFLEEWEGPDAYVSEDGQTLLAWAAVYGHEEVARVLVSRGADIEAKDATDRTPLWLASFYGHTRVVRFLLGVGANIGVTDREKRDSLMVAAQNRHEDCVAALLAQIPARVVYFETKTQSTCLMYASQGLHDGIMRMLLQSIPANLSKTFVNKVNLLGQTALSLAVFKDTSTRAQKISLIKLLLDAGASIDIGVNDRKKGTPPLLGAARPGQEELLKLLLERGANTNVRDRQGRTALSWAAEEYNSYEIVRILLAAGADVNARDTCGWTPIVYPLYRFDSGGREVIELLLASGTDINARDIAGKTALHLTVDRGMAEEMQFLIAAGADLEIQDIERQRPLQYAIRRGDQEMVDLLVAGGVKVYDGDDIHVREQVKVRQGEQLENSSAARYFKAGYKLRGG